jgi:mono/diheme cytochrome c family protein
MRRLLRFLLIAVSVIAGLVLCLLVYVQLRWDRTFTAPTTTLRATTDSATIAQGRYLAYGPAHCAYCHTAGEELWARIDAGEAVPLTGGFSFPIPPGTFYTPNLTPDPETGIGRRSDEDLVRLIRHGVRADGRASVPFMEFHGLSDEDVVALLSYLRSQPPVRNPVPEHEINLIGKAVMALMIKPPEGLPEPPATSPPGAATVERGSYLANNVALCAGCHSPRNMMSGAYEGPRFSGGNPSPSDRDPNVLLAPPNLTPHEGTGHITQWSEDQFLVRFRAGNLIPETIMPWAAYGRMTDDDIRAIYRYLRTLEPVERDPGPTVRRAEG